MERFDLKSKLAQKSVMDRIEKIRKGLVSDPIVVDFDCTTRCNLKCNFCISNEMLGDNEFSEEQLIDWADVLSDMHVKAIILTGGGEPLMNKYIGAFIAKVKQNDSSIQIGLVTNGLLLSNHPEIKDINWVRVSLDAGCRESYSLFKRCDCFDSVVDSVISFCSQQHSCDVGVSFLVLKDEAGKSNIGEIYQASMIAKKAGCDYFEVKLAFDMTHHSIRITQSEIDEIDNEVKKARDLSDSTFKVFCNSNIDRLHESGKKRDEEFSLCHTCNLRTIISPKGLYICSYHRGNQRFRYGDSNPRCFRDFWFSENRQELINGIYYNKECSFHCARKESNSIIERMIYGNFNPHLLPDEDLFI